jgi:hypothetical protein
MKTVQIESEVGSDGILLLRVPIGSSGARTKVRVTIEPLEQHVKTKDSDWHDFVERTYGSCADLDLEEPEDLPPQERDWAQ